MNRTGKRFVKTHFDLEIFQMSFDAAMRIFELSKKFPKEERYSLTDQIRRASRSVAANITEAWRKRRYEAAFVSKLSDAETEAAETQTWLLFAEKCKYLTENEVRDVRAMYEVIIPKIVTMIRNPTPWLV
jgi:four helix bundle protein